MGVERGAVALEDARAGGCLPAGDRHEVLERNRDAQQRVQPVQRAVALAARRGEPGVGGVGLVEGAFVVQREPRVEAAVRAVGAGAGARQ